MLHRNLMIRTDDGSLEQRPHVFHCVRVNVTAHPFFSRVIDCLVSRIRIARTIVGREVVRHDRGRFISKLRCDESLESFAVTIDRCIKSNLAATFNSSENHCLVSTAATVNLSRSNVLVHVLGLAANKRFVDFTDTAKKRTVGILDRFSDTMAEIPGGLVRYAKGALELQSRDALFVFSNQKDRDEPFTKR